jgi:hypothetical protein
MIDSGYLCPFTLRAHFVRPNGNPAFLGAGLLFAADACDEKRSTAYRRLSKDSLQAEEPARAQQHL